MYIGRKIQLMPCGEQFKHFRISFPYEMKNAKSQNSFVRI